MVNKRDIINNQNSGFFQDLVLRLKLILRLIGDRRVNPLLKLLPIVAALYVISPLDLIPGALIPIIGALDDAAVLWLGTTLFITLCPDEVVQEHTNALQNVVAGIWRDAGKQDEDEEIIEVEAGNMNEDQRTNSQNSSAEVCDG
jgi:uncharacterized membrane protein YkvA (DUF1232 family)